jgi:ubiquinone biosynthesis monooxygenase Coq7
MDDSKKIKSILRVNHAGELGARQIYKGMRKILGDDPDLVLMANQEEEHLKMFTQLMIEHKVKPTIFQPFWHVLSYGMGAASALMGKQAAHACTIAVEEVIVDHYQSQIDSLKNSPEHKPLMDIIDKFKKEEDHHREIAELGGGKDALGYNVLEKVVKSITKAAIRISTKL